MGFSLKKTLKEIASWLKIHEQQFEDVIVTGISIDTRTIQPGDLFVSMMIVVNIVLFIQLSSYIAIFIGLINPNFTWTSETQPIKSNLYVLLHWVICLVLLALLLGSYYFVYEKMGAYDYLEITIIVQALLIIVSRKIMETWAVNKFNEL